MTIRMFPTPVSASYANASGLTQVPPPPAPAVTAYSSTMGTVLDVVAANDMTGDVAVLRNAGYATVGLSGITALRPPVATVKAGTLYVDTSLSIVIFWDGAAWRNVVTGAIS